jgi:Vacuolar sorting 38 and autophagy-related subunit 14
VEKTLPKLVKEEPATYALFVEGVSLLAWNISWLCRTQGLNVGSDSWEDICNIGKNMWQLLVSPTAPNINAMRAVSGRDLRTKLPTTNDSNNNTKNQPKTIIQRTKSFPMLGHYSHGTSHSFLGAAEGVEFMKTWKLPTPAKIADKLKSALLGEMANAEWELLEEKEWDDDAATPNPSDEDKHTRDITTSTTTESRKTSIGENNSTTTTRPIQKQAVNQTATTATANRPSGTSGWTKLKSKEK